MEDEWVFLLVVLVFLVVILTVIVAVLLKKKGFTNVTPLDEDKIDDLAEFVRNIKKEKDLQAEAKLLKKEEQKSKLEHFRQTREELKSRLQARLGLKEWQPLSRVLNSVDKGTVGIYILYNSTKGKYYVGQAKALNARIKKHFEVEDIARDFMSGDNITVKTLTATELGDDYRIDHIEKIGIEIYDASRNGYNKTTGNS